MRGATTSFKFAKEIAFALDEGNMCLIENDAGIALHETSEGTTAPPGVLDEASSIGEARTFDGDVGQLLFECGVAHLRGERVANAACRHVSFFQQKKPEGEDNRGIENARGKTTMREKSARWSAHQRSNRFITFFFSRRWSSGDGANENMPRVQTTPIGAL